MHCPMCGSYLLTGYAELDKFYMKCGDCGADYIIQRAETGHTAKATAEVNACTIRHLREANKHLRFAGIEKSIYLKSEGWYQPLSEIVTAIKHKADMLEEG